MRVTHRKCRRTLRSRVAGALFLLAAGVLPALGQTIPNPSFEANSFTVDPGYVSVNSAITGWTASPEDKVGLNPAATSPFADNGAVPDGNNVAFLQSDGAGSAVTLSTTITGLTVGTKYTVTFRENARNGQTPNLRVSIDGVEYLAMTVYSAGGANAYWYVAFEFEAWANSHTLALVNDATGDTTVLVDDFKIAPSPGSWSTAAWTSDFDAGVDAQYFYTHAYNFGSGAGADINGVTFTGVGGGGPSVVGQFSTTWLGNVFNADGNSLTPNGDGSATLAADFVYGGTISAGNYQSVTIQGLTPGKEYVATLYTVGWEDPSLTIRWATFTAGDDHLTINQDMNYNDGGTTISYRYTADDTGSVTLKFVPISPNNVSIHIYGFSNREAVASNVAPVIAVQPQNVTVAQGLSATFGVVASGLPIPTYQWRFKGANINGATSASYTIASAGTADAGDYDVVISNAAGTLTSQTAKLTIGLPMTNPSFEEDLFTVWPGYVSGNAPITGWEALGGHGINPAAGSPFADNGAIPHGTQVAFMQADGALSQTVSGLTIGAEYYVHYYENARTGGTVPSVELQAGGVTIVPAHAVRPVGSGSYRGVFSEVFAATATDLALSFIKSNPQGGDTTALIDNVAVVPVPASTAPAVTLQPQPQLVSVADSATFTGRGMGSLPLSYQWLKNGTEISGATGQTLTLSNVQKPDEAEYAFRVSNTHGAVTSLVARLTVYEPIPDLFNTGVDDDRVALADGAIDPHWTLIANPDTGTTNVIVQTPPGAWLANTATSKWIGPQQDTVASAVGLYTYRTVIDLTDRDPKTLVIEGGWATDNTGRNILVNGVSSGNAQNTAQFASLTPFTLRGTEQNFVAGPNTIDFVVDNETAAGYTGLRVVIYRSNLAIPAGTAPEILAHPVGGELAAGDSITLTAAGSGTAPLSFQWSKNGTPIPGKTELTLTLSNVTAADSGSYTFAVTNPYGSATSNPAIVQVNKQRIPGIFGTGVAADGTLAAGGTVDPHYVLTVSADWEYPGPDAIVLNEGWPVQAGVWLPNGPNSKWISVQASQATGNAEGDYTYQTTFDLTGYDVSKVTISGGWAVDNTGVDILVNGVSTGFASTGFGTLTPFTITSGLVAGVNTLDFLINNLPATPNPVGLRVDLRGLVTVASGPTVQASLQGGNLSISWAPTAAGQKLWSAPAVTGPWSEVVNATNPYTTPASDSAKFFRVQNP